MINIRIIFIGCVENSYRLLEELLKNFAVHICGIITKATSASNSDFCDLSGLAKDYEKPFLYYSNDEEEMKRFIEDHHPDYIYCFGWSHILPAGVLSIPKKGAIGFHPAALPHNRGRHPLIWSLALGLKETASTLFYMTEGADCGDIISQVPVKIEENDTAATLYEKISIISTKQIVDVTKDILVGREQRHPQDKDKANIWRKRNGRDGEIDFRMSAQAIYNLVRALSTPYIGAHFEYQGNKYKVWTTKVMEGTHQKYCNIEPGKVIHVNCPTSFIVKTGDDLLEVLFCDTIQLTEGEYL